MVRKVVVQRFARNYAANLFFAVPAFKYDADSEVIPVFLVGENECAFVRHAENAKDRKHR